MVTKNELITDIVEVLLDMDVSNLEELLGDITEEEEETE